MIVEPTLISERQFMIPLIIGILVGICIGALVVAYILAVREPGSGYHLSDVERRDG